MKPGTDMTLQNPVTRAILRIILPYVVLAGLWILLSDRLLGLLPLDVATHTQWSIYKGLAFVLVTAFLLSALLRTELNARVRDQTALRELNTSLERRVAERTAELAVAKERAETADRFKSAFLATMSHELRTPLNSIIGFTGILIQELPGPLNAEQRKQLEMVRESSRHLLALITDVLDISKIEAGQLVVHGEPFDLRASIMKVLGIVKPLAEKRHLTLQADLAAATGSLFSDPRRIEQILLNLLTNAIKFTEEGTVTLGVEKDEASVRFSVADTGIGINPENLNKLFQPFQQVDSGLTRQHEGTGLGLAICQRLAGLLGGKIEVTSALGKGSVFTLTLPLKGPEVS